ncbi:MAG: hypothetical protein GEV04_14275 [Actinophytocola sp.]|nr:hypothetical protein [Actinophytocola sp.]
MRTLALLLGAALLCGCGAAGPDERAADPSTPTASGADEKSSPADADSTEPGNPLVSAAEREARKLGQAQELSPRDGLVLGADISYPNCPKGIGIPQRETKGLPKPLPDAEFVVIGLTNGPAYFPNPCLADQVAWAKQRKMMVAAYSVLSFPDDRQLRAYGAAGPYDGSARLGRLRNAGYAQALFNMSSLQSAGLETPVIWLDIEPVSGWEWTRDTGANFAVIQGAMKGYREAGFRLGLYSVPRYWDSIAGGRTLGLPEWRSAGETSRARAVSRCRDPEASLQGGPAILAQWWDAERDHDVTCPGVAASLSEWFHQY